MERRLAAILAADVVGYSRLMGADEGGTLAALRALRADLIDPLIEKHHGRTIKLMGDGTLVEFASVVDAVTCAVEVQKELAERNADLPSDRRLELRIGINLGDVMVDGDDLYGDGVNVAARLEALAEPGGICVSQTVANHARGKVAVAFENAGKRALKNIAEPIHVFKVRPENDHLATHRPRVADRMRGPGRWAVVAATLALVLVVVFAGLTFLQRHDAEAAKPSLAVLPFDDFSGDGGSSGFTDGLSEDLITDLSKISGLTVIARNTTFAYKGRTVTIGQVAEELDVHYVLEGSARREGDRIRINAQLIDAESGDHLWAERYDREIKDVFAVQDEITEKIVATLKIRLTGDDRARLSANHTDNIDALVEYLKGWQIVDDALDGPAWAKARDHWQRAIEFDPEFAGGYMGLGYYYRFEVVDGRSKDPEKDFQLAIDYLKKAIEVDDHLAIGLAGLGNLYGWVGNFDEALPLLERAVEVEPGYADAYVKLGDILALVDRTEEAVRMIEHAKRLNPKREWYTFNFLHAYYADGQYEKAVENGEAFIDRYGMIWSANWLLMSAYGHLGMKEEASALMSRIEASTASTKMSGRSGWVFKYPADQARYIEGLRKAGFPPEDDS